MAAALFGLLAIPTGLYAVTRLAAMVADERARRWTPLLAAPISRQGLAYTEIAVTTIGVVVLHIVAALAIWAGVRTSGASMGIGAALAGSLNTAPIAWVAVGAAALAVGALPSAVAPIGALPAVGGFLLNVVAQGTWAPTWLVRLSPFNHVAAVPRTPPDWPGMSMLAVVGAILVAMGVACYARRDLVT